MSATSLTTVLSTGTATITPVKLVALITPANSTSQIFAGTTYYGVDYAQQYGPQQVVPFFLGPRGIVDAVDRNGSDPKIVVLSSGWGAGQTGTAMGIMQTNHDPATSHLKLVILDNNTNRAGGGFWTTYWPFAPLLLTTAAPTPSNTSAPIVDVAYEYNANSDAVTYPLNVVADLNSLVAYAYGYGAQATAPVPAAALQTVPPGAQHYHYVVAPDGTVVNKFPVNGNITYVTFQSDGLPLLRPLELVPGGKILVDALSPAVTDIVNWGYTDNQPIPNDPGVTRPMGLLPPLSQTVATVERLPGDIQHGAQAAQQTPSSPGAAATPTGPPTAASTLSGSALDSQAPVLPSAPKTPTPLAKTVDMTGGNMVAPGSSQGGAVSSGGANPVQQVVGSITSALSALAGTPAHNGQKNATGDAPGTPTSTKAAAPSK